MFLGQLDPGTSAAVTAGSQAAGVGFKSISDIGTAVIDTVASLWGGKTSKDILAQQAKAQAKQAKQALALQAQQLMAQQKQVSAMELARQDQQAYEASMTQRKQQIMALYVVGGVAVIAAGYFVVKAMSKKRR